MRGDRVRARSRRRDLPENGRARVHDVEVVGWQVLVERIPRVRRAARPEQTLADGGSRYAVDAASRDPKANRCDEVTRFSPTGESHRFDPRAERHVDIYTTPGVSGLSGAFTFTGGRGGGPGLEGSTSHLARKGAGRTQRSSGVGAASIVPSGDASEHAPATVATRRSRRQRQVESGQGSSSPRGEEGRRARESKRASEVGLLKRVAVNNPTILTGPIRAKGWTRIRGIPTVR